MASVVDKGGRVGLPLPLGEMTSTRWDVVVVGAGHNGLTAAAYLARTGKRVLVLERRDVIGGAATLEEMWPGYQISPCAYLVGLLHPTVIDDLGLHNHGYRVEVADPQLFVPFADGSSFVEWQDIDRTVAGLRSWAPDQVPGYLAYTRFWARIKDALRPQNDGDLWLRVDPPSRAEIESLLGHDEASIAAVFEESQVANLERFFTDRRLVDAYAGQGTIGTNASPRDPGTASISFHHSAGTIEGVRGAWGYVPGGMGMISFMLADAAIEAGAVVAAGVPVSRVLPGRGVELESGALVSSPVVVINADPASAVRLLDGEVSTDFAQTVRNQSQESASFKVTMALSALPSLGPSFATRAQVTLTPGFDTMHEGHRAAARGELPAVFWSELYFQTSYDSTIAPAGKHVVSCFTQYAPYEFSDSTWDERRDEVAGILLGQIDAIAPGFSSLVEHVQVDGPPDIETRIGMTGGHIFHGSCLPDHMWDRRLGYRTPAEGVYLCGAGTYPGGSVMAINGRNAALAVLRDAR